MGNHLPDFSLMTDTELAVWAFKYKNPTRDEAAQIFPGRPRGYVNFVKTLSEIAGAIVQSHKAKANGELKESHELADKAEQLRDELPDFARPYR